MGQGHAGTVGHGHAGTVGQGHAGTVGQGHAGTVGQGHAGTMGQGHAGTVGHSIRTAKPLPPRSLFLMPKVKKSHSGKQLVATCSSVVPTSRRR